MMEEESGRVLSAPGSHAPHGAAEAFPPVGFDPSRWYEIDTGANASSGDAEEDAYNMGVRDGFQEAVQLIDTLTGGDGEYRYCLGDIGNERHCPDPATMIARILRHVSDSDRNPEGEKP